MSRGVRNLRAALVVLATTGGALLAGVQGAQGAAPVVAVPVATATPTTTAVAPPVVVPPSAIPPFTCPRVTVAVSNATALRTALAAARPGDVIGLAPGVYPGPFTITRSGTPVAPVYLCGPRDAVLTSPTQATGYTLYLTGVSNWRVQGLSVRFGLKGIMLDASSGVGLQDLTVGETGQEAVHLRKNSSGNVVRHLTISLTGRQNSPVGEGIYVGSAVSNWCDVTGCDPDRSDRNELLNNQISSTTAEAVDIKEGTSSGVLAGNSFDGRGLTADGGDSWVDVKGDDWTIVGNQGQNSPLDGFQQHVIVPGWGVRNVFSANASQLSTAAGTGIRLTKPDSNVVGCDNTATVGRPYTVPCVRFATPTTTPR